MWVNDRRSDAPEPPSVQQVQGPCFGRGLATFYTAVPYGVAFTMRSTVLPLVVRSSTR